MELIEQATRRLAASGAIVIGAALISLATPVAASAMGCPAQKAAPGSVSTAKAERAVLCLLNEKRAKADVHRLKRHRALNKPARKHTKLMVRTDCFAHQCPGEKDFGDRLSDYLLGGGGRVGENIAYGGGELGAPKSIVRSWMKRDGHRRNILDPDYRHIGIGVVWGNPLGTGSDAGTYTTDFGYRSS